MTFQSRLVNGEPFSVVGLRSRTCNRTEMTGHGVIPSLWERVLETNCLESIPGRIGRSVVALYTNYSSNADGDYDYVLGAQVQPVASVPEGLTAHRVPGGDYLVVTTRQGRLSEVVPQAWQSIWDWSREPAAYPRSFVCDFELYDERAIDPENGIVDIFVGVTVEPVAA